MNKFETFLFLPHFESIWRSKKPVLRISLKSWFYLSQNVGRYVDRIIGFQSLVNCIQMPISLLFLCGMWWIKDLSYFITKKGCYIATFFGFFQVNYMQCHSFFTCLFRYICILHPDKLSKFGTSSSKINSSVFKDFKS